MKTTIFATLAILLCSSQADAFKFDVWESGMDKDTILMTAQKKDIKLTGGETRYSYRDKILGENANVELNLTRGDYKLMELSITWLTSGSTREFFSLVKGVIEDKNPISKKAHLEYGLIGSSKYSCMLDNNNSVELELRLMSSVALIYKYLPLIQINKKREAWDKKEAQQKAIANDFKKFNPEASDSEANQEEQSKIYRWTDEKGVAHFSNMKRGKNASVMETRPLGKVQLKEILWYDVQLKNGQSIYKAKKINKIPGNKLAIVERAITTEFPIEEINQIAETGMLNGKMVTEMRSPDSF